jgi:replicative DNA helicase
VSVTTIDRGSRSSGANGPSGSGAPGPAEFDRQPPQDVTAEQGVLGGMLLSKDAIADVVEILRVSDFYRPAHATVYEVATELYSKGEPADTVSVAAELHRQGSLDRIGGAPYLHTLIESVPTAANAGYYAKIVAEKAVRRRLVEAGMRVTQLGYNESADAEDAVDRAQAEVFAVTERRTGDDYLPLESLINPTLEELESIANHGGGLTGVSTGFADLDAKTNGLHGGQLVVVAARPAMGKSTLALDFARHASIKNGQTSAVFSLEMSRIEIVMRLLSAEARVHLQNMRAGKMTDDDWARLAQRIGEVTSAPLFIDDSPNLTMMELRAKCRRLKQRNDLKLVVVDYLQLMTPSKRLDSRQQEVSDMSRSLKLLAKEINVPVVALSQLNRAAENRGDKKPQLSDLRESGAIEQDADLVILLHREDVYEPESARAGEADFIIAKQRNGPTGTVTVAFQGHYSRFVDMRRDG